MSVRFKKIEINTLMKQHPKWSLMPKPADDYFRNELSNTISDEKATLVVCRLFKNSTVFIGLSLCSLEDIFDEKEGKDIAYDRAISKPYASYQADSKTSKEVFKSILNQLKNTSYSELKTLVNTSIIGPGADVNTKGEII